MIYKISMHILNIRLLIFVIIEIGIFNIPGWVDELIIVKLWNNVFKITFA